MTLDELDRRFDLHRPRFENKGPARCDRVREVLKAAADVIAGETPENREQSLALTKLEEALYWAVASIVRPPA